MAEHAHISPTGLVLRAELLFAPPDRRRRDLDVFTVMESLDAAACLFS